MKKWEYKTITALDKPFILSMDNEGLMGWELVSVTINSENIAVAYFKRQNKDS